MQKIKSYGIPAIAPVQAGNVYYFSIDSLKEYLFSVIEKVVNYLRTYEKHYELIAKAKLLISKRYKEDLSLQDMADVLNVNNIGKADLFAFLLKSFKQEIIHFP